LSPLLKNSAISSVVEHLLHTEFRRVLTIT